MLLLCTHLFSPLLILTFPSLTRNPKRRLHFSGYLDYLLFAYQLLVTISFAFLDCVTALLTLLC